jgi:hypothetical protein
MISTFLILYAISKLHQFPSCNANPVAQLSGVSKDIRNFSANAFDAADKQIDAVASSRRS